MWVRSLRERPANVVPGHRWTRRGASSPTSVTWCRAESCASSLPTSTRGASFLTGRPAVLWLVWPTRRRYLRINLRLPVEREMFNFPNCLQAVIITSSDLPGAQEIKPGGAGAERVLPLYPGKMSLSLAALSALMVNSVLPECCYVLVSSFHSISGALWMPEGSRELCCSLLSEERWARASISQTTWAGVWVFFFFRQHVDSW